VCPQGLLRSFRAVPSLYVFPVIKMQQFCNSTNKVFLIFVDTPVGERHPPDILQHRVLVVLAQVAIRAGSNSRA